MRHSNYDVACDENELDTTVLDVARDPLENDANDCISDMNNLFLTEFFQSFATELCHFVRFNT